MTAIGPTLETERLILRSLVRDAFVLLDPAGVEIGKAEEQGASILRRFIPLLTSKHAIFGEGSKA